MVSWNHEEKKPPRDFGEEPAKNACIDYGGLDRYPFYRPYLARIEKLTAVGISFKGVRLLDGETPGRTHDIELSDVAKLWADLPSSLPRDPGKWTPAGGEFVILMLSDGYVEAEENDAGDLRAATGEGLGEWPASFPLRHEARILAELKRYVGTLDPKLQSKALASFQELRPSERATAESRISLRGTKVVTPALKIAPFDLDLTAERVTLEYIESAPDKGYRAVLVKLLRYDPPSGWIDFDLLHANTPAESASWDKTESLRVNAHNTDDIWPIHPSYILKSPEPGREFGVLLLSHRCLRRVGLTKAVGDPNKWPKGTEARRIEAGSLSDRVNQFLALVESEREDAAQVLRSLCGTEERSR